MKIRSLLVAAAAISAVAGAATAQVTDTGSVDVKVKFIQPLSITGDDDLDFGTATVPSAAGTITISTAGARSFTGGGPGFALLTTTGNTGGAASFSVAGEGGESISLALTLENPETDYSLSAVTVAGSGQCAGATTTSVTLSGTGAQSCSFNVGATLNFPADATGAVAVGQLQAVVAYN